MVTLTHATMYDDALYRAMELCRDRGTGDLSSFPLHYYLLLILLTKVRCLLMNIPFNETDWEHCFFLDDNLNVKNIVYVYDEEQEEEIPFSYRKDGDFHDLLEERESFDVEDELREGRAYFMQNELPLYKSPLWETEVYWFVDDYSCDYLTVSGEPGTQEFLDNLRKREDVAFDWTKEKAGAIDHLVQWSDSNGYNSMVLSSENELLVYVIESSAPQVVHDILVNKKGELSSKEQEFMILWDSKILPFTSHWGDVVCSYNDKNAWIQAIGTCNQCDNSPQNFSVSMIFYYFQKLTEELYYSYASETEVA